MLSPSPIIVIGSSNTDMVIQSETIPSPGQTLLGGKFFMNPGGKGANQAVAAARLGGHITFVARVGNDLFGENAVTNFEKEGIDTSFIGFDDKNPSGVALITVDKSGENTIVVASGANANLNPSDLQRLMDTIKPGSILLMQLEIPLATVEFVAQQAAKKNVKLILNPAPARDLPDSLLKKIHIITPNQSESERLTGIHVNDITSAAKAADVFLAKGIQIAIITLGADGALLADGHRKTHIPAMQVKAVDTTAAGDVFNGALAVALAEGMPIDDAVRFSSAAAAISVTRLGAQTSAPYRNEIEFQTNPTRK